MSTSTNRRAAEQYPIDPAGAAAAFAGFWAAPDAEIISAVVAPTVIGDWPPGGSPTQGPAGYKANIEALLEALPDIRGEVLEHAVNGDLTFVRWIARASGPNGPVEFEGIDRIRLDDDGRVVENVIRFDVGHVEDMIARRLEFK